MLGENVTKLAGRQPEALEVGCPWCGQQKGKKCMALKSSRLMATPHKQRVDQVRDLREFQNKKKSPKRVPIQHGEVVNVTSTQEWTNDFLQTV